MNVRTRSRTATSTCGSERASRTVPFVGKVIGLPVAKIASRHGGREPAELQPHAGATPSRREGGGVPVRPLPRRRHLRPEMKSTGEVIGLIDPSSSPSPEPTGGGTSLPRGGTVFVSVRDEDRRASCRWCGCSPRSAPRPSRRQAPTLPGGTGVPAAKIIEVLDGRPHIVDAIKTVEFNLFSTPPRRRRARKTAVRCDTPPSCIKCRTTPLFQSRRGSAGIKPIWRADLEVRALQSYFSSRA